MIKYYPELVQGSEEWFAARCGLLTASEMKHIITPVTLKESQNDKSRGHFYELISQRVTGYVEPTYQSDDMMRGKDDENDAKITYTEHYAPVQDIGFVTNDKWGFTLGCSPDGLVGDDGMIESKSRKQKFQVSTILDNKVPDEFILQVQTALLVTERKWCDFISYCGGMPMFVKRVEPDEKIQSAIIEAATNFHSKVEAAMLAYAELAKNFYPTERRIELEIHL